MTAWRRGTGAPALEIAAGIAVVLLFLLSRYLFVDSDIPPWPITEYSPIDEFGYTVPAFYLHHYGTWVHQAAPWAPVEGWPMNPLQNVVAAATMQLGGYTYIGLRSSSVLMALVAFVLMLALVRRLAREAQVEGVVSTGWAWGVVAGTALLLLVDFSFLLSGRVIEPTVSRLAVVATLLWLVARGTFLGAGHTPGRSLLLGATAGASVWFVYVYNAFLIPAVVATVVAWAWPRFGARGASRHVALVLAGIAVATVAYFALVFVVYGQLPLEWYRVWLSGYTETSRGSGPTLGNLRSLLEANIFRLDRGLMVTFLVSLPTFAWWTRRGMQPAAALIATCLVFFIVQSAFVADYPARKFLMLIVFVMPITAVGVLRLVEFRSWLGRSRLRLGGFAAWLAVVALVTVESLRPDNAARLFDQLADYPGSYRHEALSLVVQVGGWIGVGAVGALLVARSPRFAATAGVALMTAVLVPLLILDWRLVYRAPTTTYRDALVSVRPQVDGRTTAGDSSFGMQLYNDSRPVLNGYLYGPTLAEYEAMLVRFFSEGRADSLFGYVNPTRRDRLEELGFRLVETYSIILPRNEVLGRYEFAPDRPPP